MGDRSAISLAWHASVGDISFIGSLLLVRPVDSSASILTEALFADQQSAFAGAGISGGLNPQVDIFARSLSTVVSDCSDPETQILALCGFELASQAELPTVADLLAARLANQAELDS